MKTKKATQQPVTFPATIPPEATAIKIHGDGGARIMLDVSESDLGAFLPAVAFRGSNISVTFSVRSSEEK
jgi:hypothetical protein